MKQQTPEPRTFLISGHLNAIEHSRKRFQLVVENGRTIPGHVDEEHMPSEGMREFWGKRVTIKGLVHFRPSKRIQLLEAHQLKLMEPGEEIFDAMPVVQSDFEFSHSALQTADRGDWLKEIWGKWPGDEPIEDLLEMLERRKS